MSKRFTHILIAALMLVGAAACQRRPLEDPNEVVKIAIKVNVKSVINVNANIRNSIKLYNSNTTLWEPKLAQLDPQVMRVLVYDPSSERLLTQSFITATTLDENGQKIFTGNLGISHGDYNFLVYNFDTPTTQVSYENNEESILAYTDEISTAQKARLLGFTKTEDADPYEGTSIHYEPEHLLVANEKDVRISPHDTVVVVETVASSIIDTYYLQIRVKGLQFASEATAVITGLSPSNHIGNNIRTEDPTAAVVFDLNKGYDESLDGENKDVLCAVFNTFGKIENITSDLHVTFNVVDTAGNLLQYDANLDTVFDSELAHLYHWLIIEDAIIDIPDPGTNQQNTGNGGFQPTVDDWTEEHGEIAL